MLKPSARCGLGRGGEGRIIPAVRQPPVLRDHVGPCLGQGRRSSVPSAAISIAGRSTVAPWFWLPSLREASSTVPLRSRSRRCREGGGRGAQARALPPTVGSSPTLGVGGSAVCSPPLSVRWFSHCWQERSEAACGWSNKVALTPAVARFAAATAVSARARRIASCRLVRCSV